MLNLILDNPKTNRFCLNKFTNGKILFSLLHPATPVYFFASLLHMATFGGTGAEALKDGINSIFAENGPLHLPEDEYKLKVVTCASDGASVNFVKKTGLMKRMADERVWLIEIYCANHCVELAVKEAIVNSKFKTVDNMYMIIFGLLKNSGKLKGIIQEVCKSENIQHFTVSKITGTTQFLLIFELLIFTKLKFIIKGYNKKASEKKTLICVITFSLKCLSKQVMLFKKQCTIP